MRRAALAALVAAGACADRAPHAPLPPEPYILHYDCFHSDEPFGHGSQYRNLAVDLGALTVSLQSYELRGEPDDPDADERRPPPPTVSKLPPGRAALLRVVTKIVLSNGPYEEELPVPEGTPCTLSITSQGREVFTLEKAFTQQRDAVTALLFAL